MSKIEILREAQRLRFEADDIWEAAKRSSDPVIVRRLKARSSAIHDEAAKLEREAKSL